MPYVPSLERILKLPEQPHTVSDESERLSGQVYDSIERLRNLIRGASLATGDKNVLLDEVQRALSVFHELQLIRECHLDDFANWGDAWKQYAHGAIPVEHQVRYRLEQADT